MTIFSRLIDQVGDWNPQLFRELKGQYNRRNLMISCLISVIGQTLIFLTFKSELPDFKREGGFVDRYCLGTHPSAWNDYPKANIDNYCIPQLGHLMINWQLWWLDIFITLSIIGMIGLLGVGIYLLMADLSKEENRGTLNFLRLSPQSARSLFIGKLLGVPNLVYLAVSMGIPLHLLSGLKAGVSLMLILGFYGVVVASCVFFFNTALLLGLVTAKLGGFQAFVMSGFIGIFLLAMTGITLDAHYMTQTPLDWLTLFYPGTVLAYLTEATFIAPNRINYLQVNDLAQLQWYGQGLWNNAFVGMGLIIAHFGLWSYWVTQGLKRRFCNPSSTLLSKFQSYGVSLCFIAILLGFALQTTSDYKLYQNIRILQALIGIFMLMIVAALSPHRQVLQDWSRYRHQMKGQRKRLIEDLILGEKSPSVVAIAINLVLMITYILPSLFLFSFDTDRLPILAGLLVGSNIILMATLMAQWLLMQKTPKRAIFAIVTVASLIFLPIIGFSFLGWTSYDKPLLWLSTFIPLVAIKEASLMTMGLALLGQWTLMTLGGVLMSRQLQQMGQSETKRLIST